VIVLFLGATYFYHRRRLRTPAESKVVPVHTEDTVAAQTHGFSDEIKERHVFEKRCDSCATMLFCIGKAVPGKCREY
jgi:hypothetical protein